MQITLLSGDSGEVVFLGILSTVILMGKTKILQFQGHLGPTMLDSLTSGTTHPHEQSNC